MMLDDLLTYIDKHGPDNINGTKNTVKEFVTLAEKAERFSFDELPLESPCEEDFDGLKLYKDEQSRKHMAKLPKLTSDELSFWHEGLIPLPAPICWYEFQVHGITSGLLAMCDARRDNQVFVQRVEFQTSPKAAPYVIIDGIWTFMQKDGSIRLTTSDETVLYNLEKQQQEFVDLNYGINPSLMVYLTLMINSQTTEVRKVKPDPQRNRLRLQLRRRPERNHTVVTILPKRFIRDTKQAVPGEEHEIKHRRLHWRRSHVRTIHRGTPEEYKIVIPRFLVGRRDLGEVTHEYRVRSA